MNRGLLCNHATCDKCHTIIRNAKRSMNKYGTVKGLFESYLNEHIWRVKVQHSDGDVFDAFLNEVARQFPLSNVPGTIPLH